MTEKPKTRTGPWTMDAFYSAKELDAWLEKRDAKLYKLAELCETRSGRGKLHKLAGFFMGKGKRTAPSSVPAIRWIGIQIKTALRGGKEE